MFLRYTTRKKNGKEHRYYSLVENRRLSGGKIHQRPVLYLGEINDSQHEGWRKTIEIFEQGEPQPKTVALFPSDRALEVADKDVVRIRLKDMSLHRPRQWGGCWLAAELWHQLGLDGFWAGRLADSRKGTSWDCVLQTLVTYRLLDPGSEWRLYRHWFEHSAMRDLLGCELSLADIHKLYQCHDKVLEHKTELFTHLTNKWKDLFNAKFEVLLYDLTSTYFESDPPFPPGDKRRYGYSRDKRPDCVQVVVALIVTPEGFPLAYEVLHGNTSDRTTLADFLKKIETQYGKAQRIWVMDRGVPTEETLAQMRQSDPPVLYLVGTQRARLSKLEEQLLGLPWQSARQGVEVKLLPIENELYVLAKSDDRVCKERAMRRRQLKALWKRLKQLAAMKLERDDLLKRLGAALHEYPTGARLVETSVDKEKALLTFTLLKSKLRQTRKREGRYLLRSNIIQGYSAADLWTFYIQLTEVEAAFKTLKDDLSLRPIYHQRIERIEAHIMISFLAYALNVTLRARLRELAPGLSSRAVLEKFATIQMLDVHLPTTDGRTVELTRYTQPVIDVQILLQKLKLQLPDQPPPKITYPKHDPNSA